MKKYDLEAWMPGQKNIERLQVVVTFENFNQEDFE
jgi:seryl-tRNA synthetase